MSFIGENGVDSWSKKDKEILDSYFVGVRKFREEDFISSRIVVVECLGIPMWAWIEENLKAFSKHLGEWIQWKYQNNDNLSVYNPKIFQETSLEIWLMIQWWFLL